MISLWWPHKKISKWFQSIETVGPGSSEVECRHMGFGLIVNVKGVYHAYCIYGGCVYIDGPEQEEKWWEITINGGGKGVVFMPWWMLFCSKLD